MRNFGPCGENVSIYGLPVLAPDLTAPSTWNGASTTVSITSIDPSAGLTTVLSITSEKGYISFGQFAGMTLEDYDIKLTIDGDVIWDDTWTVTNASPILFGRTTSTTSTYDPITYNDSFLLEIQSTSDTDISFTYMKRVLA